MKPSAEGLKAAEDEYRAVWTRARTIPEALSVNTLEVAIEARDRIDIDPLLAEKDREIAGLTNKVNLLASTADERVADLMIKINSNRERIAELEKLLDDCTHSHQRQNAVVERLEDERESLRDLLERISQAPLDMYDRGIAAEIRSALDK